MESKATLVVGDSHGNYTRLLELLIQEGIVDRNTERRVNHDVGVIHLGDLGHFGADNPTGDRFCYEAAKDWFDVLLWGNHDRAVVDTDVHVFRGYQQPKPETYDRFKELRGEGVIRMAYATHGHLLTHAGLHPFFLEHSAGKDRLKGETVYDLADELNYIDERHGRHPALDYIGLRRGGRNPAGGVLWRDSSEKLADVPQVFGHSRGDKMRTYHTKNATSYCIDVGSKTNGRQGGIWLPEKKYVEVTRHQTFGVGWPD